MIKIVAPMDPRPAPRVASKGKARYKPKWYRDFQEELGYWARLAMKGRPPLKGAVKLFADCYRNLEPTSRNYGDWDNHGKAICDSLNGICFIDDRQVLTGQVNLFRGEPRIVIELEEV